ncbi:uncharacterized protein [Phaenicophaeus curvirostris]|uniref:uncharacterized protein n=1 Tax=Phaenicophaeus curvirostris TaxID=33595 RepID=UPI0037F0C496
MECPGQWPLWSWMLWAIWVLPGSGGAKPDGDPRATAAPTSHGVGTGPAAHPSSITSNTTISEAGMEIASLAGGKTTTAPWDSRATLAVPDASRSQPGPTIGSAPLGTDGTPGPAPVSPVWAEPQSGAAPRAEMWSLGTAPGMNMGVPGTLRGPREASVPVTSRAGVPTLLEGSTTAEMAPRVSPPSISTEATAGLFPPSTATPPPAMGAPGDPHADGSSAGPLVRVVSLEVGTEENPDASAAGPAPIHMVVAVRSSTEPLAQGTDDPETRPPADLPLPAPRGNHSALSATANLSLVLAKASPLLNTTAGKTLQPVTPLHPKNAASEGERDRSQLADDNSITQAALGSTPAESTRVGAVTGTLYSGDTALGTSLQASPPGAARSTAQPSTAASDHSYLTAEPTENTDVDMGFGKDTASPSTGNRAVGLPSLGGGVAEPGSGDASSSTRSAPGSESPTAVAIAGTVSPTAPEMARTPPSGLPHSTAEQDIKVSPVPGSTRSVVVAPSLTTSVNLTDPAMGAHDASLNRVMTPPSTVPSSSSAPHSSRVTLRPPPEATNSIHDPTSRILNLVAEDEPTAGVSSLAVGHTQAWEATAASQPGAGGTTAWAATTPSKRSTEGAAPPASTKSIHVPVSNTFSTSLATAPAVSIFAGKTILPPTSGGGESFVVTRATALVPTAVAKATSTSRALSLAVTHDEAGRSGRPVLSPAVRTPSVETSPDMAVPAPHSPTGDTATATSLFGVGATREPAAGQTLPDPATGGSSPTAISIRAVGQAVTTSPPSFQTSRGAARGEKTATTAGSTMTIAEGSTTGIAEGSTTTITAGSTTSITEASTMTNTAGSTTAIGEGSTTSTTAGSTTTIGEGSTMTNAAGSTTSNTAGSTTTIGEGSTMTVSAGNAMTIAAGSTTTIAEASTTTNTAGRITTISEGSTTSITGGSITSITEGSTTTIAGGSTTTIAGGSTMTITEASTTTNTAGSITAIAEGNTTSITAGSNTTITAGSITAIGEGSITSNTAGSIMTITEGSTTTITEGSTTATTAASQPSLKAASHPPLQAASQQSVKAAPQPPVQAAS